MKDFNLCEGESAEDLGIGGLYLIQNKDSFRFGTDAVVLADFAKTIKSESILDLCSGNGIIPILLSHKTDAEKIVGLEIQESVHKLAVRSVEMNGLCDRVEMVLGDLKNVREYFPKRSFSLITCNPPYMRFGGGIENTNESKYIARHEVMCNIDDVVFSASQMLSDGGHLCMVHRPQRLCDVICAMRKYEIEPKRIRFVQAKPSSAPTLFLVDGLIKGGNELIVMPPLVLYDDDGNPTAEYNRIYEREKN